MKAENQESIKWLEKAESDLKHAKLSFINGDYEWDEFACKKDVEKALKSVLIAKNFGLIKVHDLTLMARKVKAPNSIVEKCGLLNSFYIISRYPESEALLDEFEENAAADAVAAAEEVMQWRKQQLKT